MSEPTYTSHEHSPPLSVSSTSAGGEITPSALQIWWRSIRPATLWAGAAPVFVGAGLAAESGVSWSFSSGVTLLAALVGALLIQVGCNLINDYEDFERGADDERRLGPARAAARGWLSPAQLKRGARLCLGIAGAIGVYLTWVGGWPILALGVASLIAAYAYTAGPLPLAYLGLGDLFVILFFGWGAVGGTAWLLHPGLTLEMLIAGGAVGALAAAILVVNNLRDRHGDAESGKRTLAVRFGATFTRCEYTALILTAFISVGVMSLYNERWGWAAPLVLSPLAIMRIRQVRLMDGTALNPLLGKTAQLELLFCLTFTAGLMIEAAQRTGG